MRAAQLLGLALNPNIRAGLDHHAEHHDSGDDGDPEVREAVVHEHGDSLHNLAQSQEYNELISVSERSRNLPEIFLVVDEVWAPEHAQCCIGCPISQLLPCPCVREHGQLRSPPPAP